jgi:hypothetical protein
MPRWWLTSWIRRGGGLWSAPGSISREAAGEVRLTWLWVGSIVVLLAAYVIGDMTSWSLHPYYKRRLSTEYALKREGDRVGEVPYRAYQYLTDCSVTGWPEILICASARVADRGEIPTGASAASFVFSEKKIGVPLLSDPTTGELVDTEPFQWSPKGYNDRHWFTNPLLSTTTVAAMAVSGAAVTPLMTGKSKRSIEFLLALSNARLGAWVPNPRGSSDWAKWSQERGWLKSPFLSPHLPSLIRELSGRSSRNNKLIYVTDGSQYEGLGLIELLRRGCTEVYCFDASGDEVDSLARIGEAVALARSELGFEVEISGDSLEDPLSESPYASVNYAAGTIAFPKRSGPSRSGRIIYANAQVTAEAPWDVRARRMRNNKFPTDSASEELYTDERFECYGALGAHAARKTFSAMTRNALTPDI